MDQNTLVMVMAGAIVVATVAIVIQLVLLVAMFLATRQIRDQITVAVGKATPALDQAQQLLEKIRKDAAEISGKATELMDLSRTQLVRIDEVLVEATTRSRIQMDRIELVLDDVMTRFQDTAALLQNGILRPARQVSGLVAGVKAALSVFGGTKAEFGRVTHDEEMFI